MSPILMSPPSRPSIGVWIACASTGSALTAKPAAMHAATKPRRSTRTSGSRLFSSLFCRSRFIIRLPCDPFGESLFQRGGKELVCLRLRFLVCLRVVAQRQLELLAELGRLGVREGVHRARILDHFVISLRRVEILLQRLVLLLLHEWIVGAVQHQHLRLYAARRWRRRIEPERGVEASNRSEVGTR